MRLRQLKQQYPRQIDLVHRAFLLLPEEAPRRFTEYHLQHRRAAKQLSGLPFDLPEVGAPYPGSSLPALEAAEWVKQRHPEQFEAFDLALYEAFFRETRDISSTPVLLELAARLELPGSKLEAALRTHALRDAVWSDYREALDLGVTAIPTVLIGDGAISGAVPYEEYARAAQSVLRNR